MSDEPKVAAAIDFGTHGSGYAWAVKCNQNDDSATRQILSRDQWSDQPATYPKNRTALLLNKDGTVADWGHSALKKYQQQRGDSAGELVTGLQMKMFLAPAHDTAPSIGGLARRNEKLIPLYLQKLYSLALNEIQLGGFKEEDIVWCLTVPAIWDDQARDAMRRAAERAGLPTEEHRFHLGLEPEVAVQYARNALSGGGMDRAGTRIVVVDAGGGTVDITAYQVEPDGRRLAEVITADGDRLGSEYVNLAFRTEILESRLNSPGHFDGASRLLDYEEKAPGLLHDLLQAFERRKIDFDPDDPGDTNISIPGRLFRLMGDAGLDALASRQNGVDDAFVISRDAFLGLFDQVLDPMMNLIETQLDRVLANAPENVRLLGMGGFAQSRYFQRRMAERFDDGDRVRFVVPPLPALAVLHGAVHFAYDPSGTRIRRTRYTYGCDASWPFKKGDPTSSKVTDDDGAELCSTRFNAFVRIGDPVEVDQEVKCVYTPMKNNQQDMAFTLYRTTEHDPRYVTDRGSVPIGELVVKLPSAVRKLTRTERKVELCMRFGGTQTKVTARVLETGETLETSIEFKPRW
ncbi:hypothetical protein AV521_31015 [Streptomyces sp. IMTB 2501]|uniref:Hsp70 family protein n=1 Tax=Streptomyces sp. IMTB 2501 TaxID=1776340 RepID=UPI00096F6FA1|nr:hypothetical protein [Streptomyces sp. IMTB 2501]OLZ65506.1 hypothetical protein AV521_31015 [Streptomyces sp. IMTB 2501]